MKQVAVLLVFPEGVSREDAARDVSSMISQRLFQQNSRRSTGDLRATQPHQAAVAEFDADYGTPVIYQP